VERTRRKTLASAAIAKGLLPLAQQVLERRITDAELDAHVAQHVDEEKGLPRPEDVIEGVKHIIAEMVADNPEARTHQLQFIHSLSSLGSLLPTQVKGGARNLFERIAYINATRAAEGDSGKSTASDGSVYAHYEVWYPHICVCFY
jgi:transcriptional accessory protein Tex/SPT6